MTEDAYGAGRSEDVTVDAEQGVGQDELDPQAGLTGILEALEQTIAQARTVPMSSSVLVNRAEVLDLLDQAYAVLPAQLNEADQVLAAADEVRATADAALAAAQEQAEQVMAAAQDRAERVITAARARADELVGSEQLAVAAGVRAQEIIAEAQRTAESIRREADTYCDGRLAALETELGAVLAQVQAGRAALAERLSTEE